MAEDLDKQIRGLEKKLRRYSNKEVPRAASSAINKVTKMVRTAVVRKVAQDENIPNKLINKKTFIKNSTAKSQRATFTIYTTGISVAGLIRKDTLNKKAGSGTNKKGVTVKGRKYKGAFINSGKHGTLMVYQRKGKSRYPISAVKINIQKPIMQAVPSISQRLMRTEYRRLYENDLKYRISKYER